MIAYGLLVGNRKRRISEKCRFDVLAFPKEIITTLIIRCAQLRQVVTAFKEG